MNTPSNLNISATNSDNKVVVAQAAGEKPIAAAAKLQAGLPNRVTYNAERLSAVLAKKKLLNVGADDEPSVQNQEAIQVAQLTIAQNDSAPAIEVSSADATQVAATGLDVNADTLAVGALPESGVVPWAALQAGGGGANSLAWLGALALGAAAAAGGGGGGGGGFSSSIAPSVTKSLGGSLSNGSDSGTKGDNTTNNNKPTIIGGATPGATVTIAIDTNGDGKPDVTMTAVADADGNWEATPSSALPDGSFTAVVSAKDAAGTVSAPLAIPLIIDTGVPVSPEGDLDPASDTAAAGDALTNNATPTIAGSGTPGEQISVVIGNQTLLTTVGPDGKWSVTPETALPDGPYTAVVTSFDNAGNVSAPINIPVTIDTTVSVTPVLSPASDSATPGDAITNVNKPTIQGTGTPGDKITVTSPTGEVIKTVVGVDGTWSATSTAALPEGGPQNFSVVASDAAGNTSAPVLVPVTIDTVAPAAPTALLDPTSDSGTVGDALTKDNTPNIVGTGKPGDTITVTSPTGEKMTTVVALDGRWLVTPKDALPDGGPQNFSVTATDPAGNVSPTALVAVTIDTAVPTLAITGPIMTDGSINSAEEGATTIAGTTSGVEAGRLVNIVISDADPATADIITTAVVAANGTWTATGVDLTSLNNGTLTITANVADAAGNAAPTATASAILDATAPSIGITGPIMTDGKINAVEEAATTIAGTTSGVEAGRLVTITIKDTDPATADIITTAIVAANGTWSAQGVDLTALNNGTLTIIANVADAAGNAAPTATTSATLDATAPSIGIIGPIMSDGRINAAEAGVTAIAGITTGVEAGRLVNITISDTDPATADITTTAVVAADGTWSATGVDLSALNNGTLAITANVADAAGNAAPTASASAELDAAAPSVGITGPIMTDGRINAAEDNATTIAGTTAGVEAGRLVTITISDTDPATADIITTALVAADGTWSATGVDLSALNNGTLTMIANVADAAGNAAPTATASAVLDKTPPVVPTTTQLLTNDNTPVLTGTTGTGVALEPGASMTVAVNGATYSVVPNATGNWSLDLQTATPLSGALAALGEGGYSVTTTVTDSAGNSSVELSVNELEIDTKAPVNTSLAAVNEDVLSDVNLNALDRADAVFNSGLSTATIVSLPTQGTLYLANGTTAVTLGQTLSQAQLTTLKFRSNLNSDVDAEFIVDAVDRAGNPSTVTVTIPVTAVADADPITVSPAAPEITAASSGLTRSVFDASLSLDALAPATSLNGFTQKTRVSVIAGAMDTTQATSSSNDVSTLAVAPFTGTFMSKFTGLIYLTAGTYVTSTNGVPVDETVKVVLGGKTTLTVENFATPQVQTDLVVTDAGYYTIDTYFMNFGGAGVLPNIHLAKDGGTPIFINTTNFKLYRNVAELESMLGTAGTGLSDLQGSPDGTNGYYVANAEGRGSAGDKIKLQTIAITPVDTDGSETNTVTISDIPVGLTLSSGVNTFTAATGNQSVNVTGWNLATLFLDTTRNTPAGTFNLTVTSTSVESSNSTTASTTALLPVDIALNTKTYSGTSGNDTGANMVEGANGANRLFGGGGADTLDGGLQNDMIYGGSAGLVRNGGFEYWNIQGSAITGGSAFIYQQFAANTVNSSGDGALGGWITGGAGYQGSGTQNKAELLDPFVASAGNIPNQGRFILDLSSSENVPDDLFMRQSITTMPGEIYTLNIAMRAEATSDVVQVLWGDVVIASVSGGTTPTVTMYHGYSAAIVTTVLNADSSPSVYKNFQFTVKGSVDAATTTLAIQADALTVGGNVREMLYVNMAPVVADGADTLIGNLGSDILYGQGGNDVLIGGVQGNAAADLGSTDVFVYSYGQNNGADTVLDFQVGTDRIYLADVVDAYVGPIGGSTSWANSGNIQHMSRYPGNEVGAPANATAQSDNNLTMRDFTYANQDNNLLTATGQRSQYITVSADGSGDLVIHLNTLGGTVGATNDNMGSVTLSGVKFGSGADQYDSVADLFGQGGSTRLIWATTDGFKDPVGTTVFEGNNVQNFDWMNLTNINSNLIIGG